ncbi:MAG: hypothetical protein J6V23_03575 [Bacteroidaceae bacterium]|nr:hypothetical protein [Bacteroidaceae bacterium]
MRLKKKIAERLSYDERCSLSMLKTYFWHINWIKTIWFNFKALPFKKAIKIPFVLSYNTTIKNIGKIELCDEIHTGMISLGVSRVPGIDSNLNKIFFCNNGTLKIKGNLHIHSGVLILISNKATFELGKRVKFGCKNRVICRNSIVIGNDFRMSWEGQMFDTNFHFLHNIEKDKYYPRNKPIIIGNNVFIGNRCTIGCGTIIPSGSVISCVSKVGGDYSKEGENLLLSGNPATIIKKGVNMGNSWFVEKENEISKMFNE